MFMSGSISQPLSPSRRGTVAYHGLHLVPDAKSVMGARQAGPNFFYRIAAAGAALFLAMTIC